MDVFIIKMLTLIYLIIKSATEPLIKENFNPIDVECIDAAINKYVKPDNLVLMVRTDLLPHRLNASSKIQSIVLNYKHNYYIQLSSTPRRFNVYVGIFQENNLIQIFSVLRKMFGWNPRALFILGLEGNLRNFFKIASENYVYNVVISQNNSYYTYFPLNYENLNNPEIEPIDIGVCNDINSLELFPEKIPKYWRNSTVTISAVSLEPYVISVESKKGLEVTIVENILASELQFMVKYTKVDTFWGVRLNDGNYTAGFEEIFTGKTDFGIGHFHIRSPESMYEFDISFSYTDDDVVWVVPASVKLPLWMNLLHVFSIKSWVFILMTMLISCASWCVISKWVLFEDPFYKDLWNVVLTPMVFIFGEMSSKVHRSRPLKTLYITTWMFSFIIDSTWQAYLIYYMCLTTYGHQISSVDEFIDKKIRIGLNDELAILYLNSNTTQGTYIYENNQGSYSRGLFEELDRVATKKDSVAVSTKRIMRYTLPKRYQSSVGRKLLFLLQEILTKDFTVMPFHKGFPCFEAINKILISIREAGIIDFLDTTIEHTAQIENSLTMSKLTRFETNALTFSHMEAIFVLGFSGYFISFIVFILELFYHKKKQFVSD